MDIVGHVRILQIEIFKICLIHHHKKTHRPIWCLIYKWYFIIRKYVCYYYHVSKLYEIADLKAGGLTL